MTFLSRAFGFLKRSANRFYWRLFERRTKTLFHRLYYDGRGSQTWESTTYMGTRILKCPLDLWVYQEILYETKPDLIIETGTFNGGSALYLAHLCETLGVGEVISVDIDPQPNLPMHPRIRYIKDSSVAPEVLAKLQDVVAQKQRVMVILDSDHSRDHVLAELRAYHSFVTPGCYLIVEDGNINGHPVLKEFGPGPTEALEVFLLENADCEVDKNREKFLISFNPGGYLKKKE